MPDSARFKFREGDRVTLRAGAYPYSSPKVGDVGIVWGVYKSDPPLYEVSFTDSDGTTFDFTVDEEEIGKADGIEPEPGGLGHTRLQSIDP